MTPSSQTTASNPAPSSPQTTTSTIIIALSGPSSSGKTTLARLLRTLFTHPPNLTTTILHQDDFYKPDSLIPLKSFSSPAYGSRLLADWDCIEAIDLPALSTTLHHIKTYSRLPPSTTSKEDQNTIGPSPVSKLTLSSLTTETRSRLTALFQHQQPQTKIALYLLDGFLLFPSPHLPVSDPRSHLREVIASTAAARLFVPCTREQTVRRRAQRSGYVTLEGFWEDPEGYVEDVVWGNYAVDHAWMFSGQRRADGEEEGNEEVRRRIDAGEVVGEVVQGEGVMVAPLAGEEEGLEGVLTWACERVWAVIEEVVGR